MIRTKDIKLHCRYLSITINIKDKQKEVFFFPSVTKIHFNMKWDLRREHKLCRSQRSLHPGAYGSASSRVSSPAVEHLFPEARNAGIQA